jgi:hypothetical protein
MTELLLDIPDNEWRVLGISAVAADSDSTGVSPTLCIGDGAYLPDGHWTVLGADGTIVAVGHEASENAIDLPDISLPVDLLRNAVVLVNTGESCHLSVDDDGYVGIRSENGSVAVSDAEQQEPVEFPDGFGMTAYGIAGAMDLWRAIGGAGQVPGTVDPDLPIPVMQIGIDPSSIGFSVDWRRYDLNRSTYRAPAGRTEGAGIAGLAPATITSLLHRTAERRSDIEVEVGISEEWVTFNTLNTGGGWKAWVPRLPIGALEYGGEVEAALTHAGLEWNWTQSGSICVDVVGGTVEVGFFDTWPETLRLSKVVTDGLAEDIELHRALASLNASKVGLRFWFADGHVIVASDLPCYRHIELVAAIEHLRSHTEGLGILLRSTGTVDAGGAESVEG